MNSLAFRSFLRSKIVIGGLVLVFAVGIISILTGKQFLLREEKAIHQATVHQQEHIQRNVAFFNKDFGLLMYYLRFAFVNQPSKMTGVSIGQRDVNPTIQAVTIRNLEAQKYDNDLTNPANLLSGNLDLGFVVIYLFPLLILSTTFNLLSEEVEGGTWRLVNAQSPSALGFLLGKLGVRMVVIYGLLAVLMLAAVVILGLPLNAAFAGFVSVSMLYLAFWFALCFLMAALHKNSSFNALILLACWLMLTVLLPAAVNNAVANKYPVPEALSTMMKQRDSYHEKWDEPQNPTIEKFYAIYPQFRKYGFPEIQNFGWLWYYAAQQMGDAESAEDAAKMRSKLLQREKASSIIAAFIPTMHTQLQLNAIAGSDISNHLQFLDSTTAFHKRLRMHFYPKIFAKAPASGENWKAFIPQYFSVATEMNWIRALAPLFWANLLLWLAAILMLEKLL